MTLIREVADAVALVHQVVQDTREIVESVNDGRAYLAARHPEAGPAFADLLHQMQLTVLGLAEATKVVTRFRFTLDDSRSAAEVARFNDYVIAQQAALADLRGRVHELKGSSSKVREIRDALDARSTDRGWASMFGLLGAAGRARAGEMASALSNFYADDQRLVEVVQTMTDLADRALLDASAALGPPATADPWHVPHAVAVLQVYAAAFAGPQQELVRLLEALRETERSLTA